MDNECEYCGKSFEKLSQLYMHKNSHTPSLLLHQHPHPAFGDDAKQLVPVSAKQSITKRKIKTDSELERRKKPYGKKSEWSSEFEKEAKLGAKLTEKSFAILEKMDSTDHDLGS